MRRERILITGASGCVGQYTVCWLLKNSDAELFLWLRDPSKLTAIPLQEPRIHLLVGDLRDTKLFEKELSTITRVIHTATAWGDPKRAHQVNIVAVKNMLNCLDDKTIKQIIYFSTASILNKDLKPLPEALSYGTEYIQTKAQCLKELERHPLAKKIIAVFPTLVFGGRIDSTGPFPTSYLTEGLMEASRWLWLARWLRVDSKFHFIHAADIAFICGHLATNPHKPNPEANQGSLRRIVLAQPSISINEAIKKLCLWRGIKLMPGIPLWGWLIEALTQVLPIRINDWDRFSIKQRYFIHNPITNPERFGGHSHAATLEEVLADSGLPKVRSRPKRVRIGVKR